MRQNTTNHPAMNFNQLKYIIAIDKYKNFTRAAESCNIAQSTLSKEIQRLEQELNVIIFDRSRVPVVPTDKGEDLLKLAHEILHKANQFTLTARQKDDIPEGSFNLGVLSCLAPYILPFFIENITKKYPGIYLNIIELSSSEMEKMLSNNELDGAIVISPFVKTGYYESLLFEEEFVLYTGPNHTIHNKDNVYLSDIPISDFKLHKDLHHLFVPAGTKYSLPYSYHTDDKVKFHNGSLETIRKIIDINGGVTILPGLIKHFLPEFKLCRIKKVNNETMKQKISFISPRFFQKENIIKVLRSEITKSLP